MAYRVADQVCGFCEAKETVLLFPDVDIQKSSNKQVQRGCPEGWCVQRQAVMIAVVSWLLPEQSLSGPP